ncbi:hypothetical protein ANN_06452 [Periplaneta americana]|uniref:Uncharacterized protein n=1 Tax=Periplaneta americana TaxID=6978 RepID=A0ABQ8TDK4_PERAM|nr:hypothetical protein ANN_06452 [Periplaneta americana]
MTLGSGAESYPAFAFNRGLSPRVALFIRLRPENPISVGSNRQSAVFGSIGRIGLITKEGLLLVDIMPHRSIINSDAYVAALKKLKARLSRVRRHREKQDVLLLHDNA